MRCIKSFIQIAGISSRPLEAQVHWRMTLKCSALISPDLVYFGQPYPRIRLKHMASLILYLSILYWAPLLALPRIVTFSDGELCTLQYSCRCCKPWPSLLLRYFSVCRHLHAFLRALAVSLIVNKMFPVIGEVCEYNWLAFAWGCVVKLNCDQIFRLDKIIWLCLMFVLRNPLGHVIGFHSSRRNVNEPLGGRFL